MYIWMKVHSNNHGSSSCTAGSTALDHALETLQAAVDEGRATAGYCHMAIYSVHVQFEALSQGSILGKDLFSGPVNQMHISIHFDFVDSYDSDESLAMDNQQPGMMTCELSHNRLTIRNAFSPQTSTFSGCTGRLCLWFSESLFLPSLALPIIVHGALSQMLSIRPDNWSATSHLMQLCLPYGGPQVQNTKDIKRNTFELNRPKSIVSKHNWMIHVTNTIRDNTQELPTDTY